MKSLHATVFSPTPLPLFPLILGPGTKFAALKTHNLPSSESPTQEFPQNTGDLLWSRVLVVRKGWAWKIFPFTWLFIFGVAKFCKKISLNFCAFLIISEPLKFHLTLTPTTYWTPRDFLYVSISRALHSSISSSSFHFKKNLSLLPLISGHHPVNPERI